MLRYPTPQDLAEAKLEDVVEFFQHLGLQNQRAKKCVALAKAWLSEPPMKGKRWRRLHYPKRNDGKDISLGSGPIDDDDERVAWEVGHLPGIGAYAIDSWRIFCRDRLRGLPCELPRMDRMTDEKKEEEMKGEWARVLPKDKELRAYLRWRWLRLGWVWDPLTGKKEPADVEALAKVKNGGVVVEGSGGAAEVLGGAEGGVVVKQEGIGPKHGNGEDGNDVDILEIDGDQGEVEEEWMFTPSSWELRNTGG